MEQQFVKLEAAIEEDDVDKIITISDVILLKNPNDIEANKCKVVTFMKAEKFHDAIRHIDKIPAEKTRQALAFEKAYSLYSLKKYSDAEDLLSKMSQKIINDSDSLLAVKAQLLFRVNKFAECSEAYRTLLKRATDRLAKAKGGDDEDDVTRDVTELSANLCAAYCEAGEAELCARLVATWHFGESEDDDVSEHPCAQAFECGFNAACHYAAEGDSANGDVTLATAERLYRDYLSEDEDSDDVSIASALAGFTAQAGYFDVIRGDAAAALQKYAKAHDDAKATSEVKIISANNCAALGDAPAAALKKMAAAAHNDVALARLSARQREAICLTKVILVAKVGGPNCAERLRAASDEYLKAAEDREAAEENVAVLSALGTKSTKGLVGYLSKGKSTSSPESFERPVFVLAQLLLEKGQHKEAADAICEYLGMEYVAGKKAVAAAVVRLYDVSKEGDDRAAEVLVKCAEAHKDDASFLKMVAQILEKRKRPQQAELVLGLEKKKKPQPKKKEAAPVDPRKVEELAAENVAQAEKLCKGLEPLPALPAGLSLDALEALPKPQKAAGAPINDVIIQGKGKEAAAGAAAGAAGEKKKKKKRRGKLPKDYDPNKKPDPDRWLPKEMKKAIKEKKGGKGRKKKESQKDSLERGLPGARDAEMEEKLGMHNEDMATQEAIKKVTATLPKAVRQGGGGRKMSRKQKKKIEK